MLTLDAEKRETFVIGHLSLVIESWLPESFLPRRVTKDQGLRTNDKRCLCSLPSHLVDSHGDKFISKDQR